MKILKKRILAYTLALAIILSSLVFGVSTISAEVPETPTDYDVWEGDTATGFANPDAAGTEADPYIIETAEQLRYMIENYTKTGASKGKFFKITKDIYLNDISNVNDPVDLWGKQNWLAGYGETVPVPANNVNLFEGTLDGDGHTIYGLYVNGVAFAGLFPAVSSYATIKNLSLEKVFITGGSGSAGAIAGWAEYTSWQSATQITNCSVVDATIGQSANIEFVGGLVGRIDTTSVTVTNCSAYGLTLSQDTGRGIAGGLIGFAQDSGTLKINNSFSVGYFATCSQITKAICTNVYTTADIPEGYTNGGVTKLIDDQMKGDAAKANMAFDFDVSWKVTSGYPVATGVEPWSGSAAAGYAGGNGSEENPYLISNADQLFKMVNENTTVNTDGAFAELNYFKITKDIVINAVTDAEMEAAKAMAKPSDVVSAWDGKGYKTWNPGYTGNQTSKGFYGVVDGDGHTIHGLYIKEGQYVGLIPVIVDNASITNLKVENSFVRASSGSASPGVLVGIVYGKKNNYPTVDVTYTMLDNCYVAADAGNSSWRLGGVIGGAMDSKKITITNCAVTNIKMTTANTGTVGRAGAFLGNPGSGSHVISNCYTDSSTHPVSNTTDTQANYDQLHKYVTFTNVYTSADKPTFDTYDDITYLTANQMQGENAKTYMPGLDFYGLWKTTNSYPVLRDMDDRMEAWDGTKAETFAGGDGTVNKPYQIANGAQLYKMVAEYSNADVTVAPETQTYFRITADINLGGKKWYTNTIWQDDLTSTNYTKGFNGVIYGEGHTIYGLTVNGTSDYSNVGLIPFATQGAEIHDLHLAGGYLKQTGWNGRAVGALIGLAVGVAGSEPIVIEGCSVKDFNIQSENGSAAFVAYSYSQSINIKDSFVVNTTMTQTGTDANSNSAAFIAVMRGSAEYNSVVIENSYYCGDGALQFIELEDDFSEITTFKNVYTTSAAYDGSVEGLTKLDDAQMKAKLAGFNYNQVWQTTDNGYSVHRDFAVQKELFTGTAALEYAGGTGTEEEPYLISNADQLYKLATATREETLGNFYKLTNDISISRVYDGWANDNLYTWAAVKTYFLDTYSDSFAGTLDGAGYTVSGLYYNNEITDGGNYAYGVIPFVTANAVIKNLTVKDVNATVIGDGASVGAVIGATHLTTADAENALNFVNLVGVKAENSVINGADDNSVIGKAATGVKIDPTVADENTLIFNALNTNEDAIAAIRNNLVGNSDKYITDVNAVEGFDIADLVYAVKKKEIIVDTDSYALVWAQEFDGDALDNSVWSFNTGMSQKTNLKYVEDNNEVSNGTLKLTATDSGEVDTNGNKIYNVNKGISTIDTMSFKYGRLEMKAKIPFGAGAFPSLWLTSRNAIGYEAGAYGYDNEIDIFEVFGKTTSQNQMVTCIHKWYVDEAGNRIKDKNDKNVECSCGTDESEGNAYNISAANRSHTVKTEDAKAEWHTIVFEWTEDAMTFSVDGEIYYTAKKSAMDSASAFDFSSLRMVKGFDKDDYNTDNAGIFNRPMYLRLNNHMYTPGGTSYVFGGSESDIDPSKLTYEIDYIKLYQKDNGEINLK